MPAEPASGHLLFKINANEPFFFMKVPLMVSLRIRST